jgi:RNA polymerase sigma factor (sigma-70 family)
MKPKNISHSTDEAALVSQSLAGDRDAFAAIVGRHQSLICSLAYGATGSLSQSEDLAQETFVTAWKQLASLRDHSKLRPWLCRIARNLISDKLRLESREPSHAAERVDCLMDLPSPESHPLQQVIGKEEEAILWRAVDRVPEIYRVPLVLFYREHQSIAEVAEAMDLNEQTVKQRLSRARKLLHKEVIGFVQGALKQTRPGPGFTAGVLAALPAVLPPASEAIVAASGTVTASKALLKGQRKTTAASGTAALLSGWRDLLPSFAPEILAGFVGALLITGVFLLISSSSRSPSGTDEEKSLAALRTERSERFSLDHGSFAKGISAFRPAASDNVRLRMMILDAATGEGVGGAKIRAAYFYAGGRGERHDIISDENGLALIPEAFEPGKRGMNIFVVASEYVPKAVGFHKGHPDEYTMKLDRALTIGGVVVDEFAAPVPGVAIRVQPSDRHESDAENIDFQTIDVRTDADGRWICPHIPKHYNTARMIVLHDDYPVTLPDVPVNAPDSMNLILVLERGFAVSGIVTDEAGQPIPGAIVRELEPSSYRRHSATSGPDGRFVFHGVGRYASYSTRPPEWNAQGARVYRGLAAFGEASVELAVEANGFAPQVRKLELMQRENTADFALSPGNIFMGRVLDGSGNPIPGAAVRTDTKNGIRKFHWFTLTDAEGRFQWDSAPAEPVLFWFEAEGYHWERDVALVPGQSTYEIRLRRQEYPHGVRDD